MAGDNDEGRRVDAFLQRVLPNAPKSILYKYIRINKVKLNGKKPKPDTRLMSGDVVTYYGADTFLTENNTDYGEKLRHAAKGILPKVVYEDENILIVYKPRGIACQPDSARQTGTLIDGLKWYLYQTGSYQPDVENGFSPALCNRLDVNTEGLCIGAKTLAALREMNEKIRIGEVRKFYRCRVRGVPSPLEGTIKTNLKKEEKQNISRVAKDGKPAETRYQTIETDGKTSTLEIELITGRSHQIRVHMQSIGCPILGDPKYGDGGKGQELCAYRVFFDFSAADGVLGYLRGKSIEWKS